MGNYNHVFTDSEMTHTNRPTNLSLKDRFGLYSICALVASTAVIIGFVGFMLYYQTVPLT